jgi:hypothetical protein
VQCIVVMLCLAAWAANIGNVQVSNWLGTFSLSDITELFRQPSFWLWVGIINAALVVLQALFLIPVRKPRARSARGIPIWLSATISGAAAATLLVGLGAAVTELFNVLNRGVSIDDDLRTLLVTAACCAIAASWLISTILIRSFLAKRVSDGESHERALSRVAGILFKGSLVEALAVIPLDVMVRKKTDCYSFSGTVLALTLCFSIGLLMLGPAIALPLLAKRRKEWWHSRCECCGYDMSQLLSSNRAVERCPECGAGWKHDLVKP